ncbi:hypothetical protein [Pseudomonas palmensis]|uniref:hypothetical protein n=1 Tax=Pseudomonas palmensis TaxID=2815362 RepID=UPI003CEC4010
MSKPPSQIVLSGAAHSAKVLFPNVGDVAVHPGPGRTKYIDATIYDGDSWRVLHLKSFGFGSGSRVYCEPHQIGPIMRDIQNKIISCRGGVVYHEIPFGEKKHKYVYRGAPISSFLQPNPWGI